MSTELKILKSTGSRGVDMHVTRYWGGDANGPCLQLTAKEEEGGYGYVQINKKDLQKINELWEENCKC